LVVERKENGRGQRAGVHRQIPRPGSDQFPDSGFTTAAIEMKVTSNDGKRVENISIAKSGANYIAKRDGEPSLYQLDAKLSKISRRQPPTSSQRQKQSPLPPALQPRSRALRLTALHRRRHRICRLCRAATS